MPKEDKIPEPTIERIALYSRPLEELLQSGKAVVSSEELAELCDVNSAQVRKDLAYFGEFGVRGVGYNVRDLLKEIKSILATDRKWNVCIVGMGNMGSALVENENFRKRGYNFAAAFDSNPNTVGKRLPCGLTVEPLNRIPERIREHRIQIGVITSSPVEAQRIADMFVQCGVKAILNFAQIHLRTPECCIIENVDVTVKMENLVYHLAKIS